MVIISPGALLPNKKPKIYKIFLKPQLLSMKVLKKAFWSTIVTLIILPLLLTDVRAANPHPLAPPDTSSPRATLKSFQDIMGEYGRMLKKDIHTKSQVSELRSEILEEKAMRCLDLSNLPKERMNDIHRLFLQAELQSLIAKKKTTLVP